MERAGRGGLRADSPPREPVEPDEACPAGQEFGTVGHLYRGIEHGLRGLVRPFGERAVFVGSPRAQATPELFRWPQLVAVTRPGSAIGRDQRDHRAGRGRAGDWRPAHYGRFLAIWEEYHKLTEARPGVRAGPPVIPAFTRQPFDIAEPQPLITDPLTRS